MAVSKDFVITLEALSTARFTQKMLFVNMSAKIV